MLIQVLSELYKYQSSIIGGQILLSLHSSAEQNNQTRGLKYVLAIALQSALLTHKKLYRDMSTLSNAFSSIYKSTKHIYEAPTNLGLAAQEVKGIDKEEELSVYKTSQVDKLEFRAQNIGVQEGIVGIS